MKTSWASTPVLACASRRGFAASVESACSENLPFVSACNCALRDQSLSAANAEIFSTNYAVHQPIPFDRAWLAGGSGCHLRVLTPSGRFSQSVGSATKRALLAALAPAQIDAFL